MAISNGDAKLLWGRAAGMCSNPSCREDLTAILQDNINYNVGEMAHIIARSEQGPRGIAEGGSDSYENLILLCPTCHRHIDKSSPGIFTTEKLLQWKETHETKIRFICSDIIYSSFEELKEVVSKLLLENHMLWINYGPNSKIAENDPGSNAYKIWELRKLDSIIPTNLKILNLIEANKSLLDIQTYKVFVQFKTHASSFEANQYERIDNYVAFPKEFSEVFG